ncbi:hypothetical protein MMC13_007551 [Lambiella insularis]|nr:hypothetical protein [Lambiella insularis]
MPSTRSSRSSKRQTRLAFTPLPSSSPQASSLSSGIRTRAAAVRYGSLESPTKRQRIVDTAGLADTSGPRTPHRPKEAPTAGNVLVESMPLLSPFKWPWSAAKKRGDTLPTPDASSQLEVAEPVSDGETISSDTESNAIRSKALTAQPITIQSKSRNKSKVSLRTTTDLGTQDDEDTPLAKRSHRSKATNTVVISSNEEEDEDEVLPSSPMSRRRRSIVGNRGTPFLDRSRPSSSRALNPHQPLFGKIGNQTPIRGPQQRAVVTATGKKMQTRSSTRKTPVSRARERPATRRFRKQRSNTQESDSSSDSTLPGIKTLLTPKRGSEQAANTTSEDYSDDIAPGKSGKQVQPRQTGRAIIVESEDSEDVIVSPTKRKRLVRPVEQPLRSKIPRRQVDEDLDEDLEMLQDTELRNERTRDKAVPVSKRSAALEALKASRAGQTAVNISSDSEILHTGRGVRESIDSSSEIETIEDEDSGTEAIRQAIRDDEGEYDEDFVDDDDTLGAPVGLEEMPLKFTRHAHKKTKEHFKDVIEWMVHKKLNPAFPRDDPVYRVAFYKLDDEVKGYAGSKFLSSAWLGDFAKAIKARPEFHEVAIPHDPFAMANFHHCDACNRTNHPATFIVTFGGKAYHPETLEKLSEDDEDETAESDDDAKSRDIRGNVLPDVEKEYCKANAEIAHSLLHWRYFLNDWVLDFLHNEGYTTPAKIVERESWSIKKRGDFANKVVDEMEEKGEIRALYRDFKINLDAARNYKVITMRVSMVAMLTAPSLSDSGDDE